MTTRHPLRSKILGALLAHHAGDSLGATLEFETHAQIKESHPHGLRDIIGGGAFAWQAGQATDDSDMTRGLLLAYRDLLLLPSTTTSEERSGIAPLAARYFLLWLTTPWPSRPPGSTPVDVGTATLKGLTNLLRGGNPSTSGAGQGSAGNGSLMRCLPTGLFRPATASIVAEATAVSAITHNDERCTLSCAAYCVMASRLIRGDGAETAVEAGLAVAEGARGMPVVAKAIRAGRGPSCLARMAEEGPDPDILFDLGGGYVLDSLTLAVAAVLDERGLEDVLVDVIRVGRDTDTNGAIAGGLLGARDGVEAIPERWLSKLQYRQEYERIVSEILTEVDVGDSSA